MTARLTDVIADAEVRAYFEATEDAGTRKFLYAAKTGTVKYYVFLWRDDPSGAWQDGKAPKEALLAGTWKTRKG